MTDTAKYSRIMSLATSRVWALEPTRALEMAEALVNRIETGARSTPYLTEDEASANRQRAAVHKVPMAPRGGRSKAQENVAVIPMIGSILPRGNVRDVSGGGSVNLTRFQREFMAAADDPTVGAILLEVDSPGGQVDLVEETAAIVRDARRPGRPIVAIANTLAASAAYWIAAQADELVASPSAQVGSIGVFQLHQNLEGQAAAAGIKPFYVYSGPRKVEGNPFEPMPGAARAHFQAEVDATYARFVDSVAAGRGVKPAVVRADPESGADAHFGGGRAYSTTRLEEMGLIGRGGMVDRVETMQATLDRLINRRSLTQRRARVQKAKLAMI